VSTRASDSPHPNRQRKSTRSVMRSRRVDAP
jgi:hypothetical protein